RKPRGRRRRWRRRGIASWPACLAGRVGEGLESVDEGVGALRAAGHLVLVRAGGAEASEVAGLELLQDTRREIVGDATDVEGALELPSRQAGHDDTDARRGRGAERAGNVRVEMVGVAGLSVSVCLREARASGAQTAARRRDA